MSEGKTSLGLNDKALHTYLLHLATHFIGTITVKAISIESCLSRKKNRILLKSCYIWVDSQSVESAPRFPPGQPSGSPDLACALQSACLLSFGQAPLLCPLKSGFLRHDLASQPLLLFFDGLVFTKEISVKLLGKECATEFVTRR